MRRFSPLFFSLSTLVLGLVWPLATLAQTTSTPSAPSGYGALLFQLVIVVVGVCVLAYLILRFGVKRFFSPDGSSDGPLEVVARLPVEPRRSILVVRVGSKHLVVGSSEAGMTALGEVDAATLSGGQTRSFAEVLEGTTDDEAPESDADSATNEGNGRKRE